jgi:TetR/AcrR family transcriptional repressor of nem operon
MPIPHSGNSDTRSRLVDGARGLFYSRGYGATSLASVAEHSNANPGSLYYFFKTKEQLLLAVLESYMELLGPVIVDPATYREAHPIERVFAILDRYREFLLLSDCEEGCPIGNLAIEITGEAPAVRALIEQNFDAWSAAIHGCLEAGSDQLPGDIDLGQLAQFVLTVMEGAVLQARGRRSIDPFDQSIEQLRDYFNRLLATAKENQNT